MKKADNFDATKWLVENKLTNQSRLDELSSDAIKKAIDVSKSRGTDSRTYKMGKLYFNQFVGKPFMGGKITDIGISNPSQGNYKQVVVSFEHRTPQESGYNKGEDIVKTDYIYYDIDKDLFDMESVAIDRKDAVVLAKIALKINPDSKYKETGKYFKIKGY
jgi:hypothetical protein